MRYDIAIIGRGPAGLSAALNAKVRNKSVIVFGNKSKSLEKSPRINNFLGFYDISGQNLVDKFEDSISNYDIDFSDKRVQTVYAMGDYFAIALPLNEMVEATSVIIASGIELSKDIENEDKFVGMGVGYCATCDAALYKGKKVVVIGYNEESIEEANFIEEIVDEVVFVNMYKKGIKLKDTIKVIEDKPIRFEGNMKANKLIMKNSTIEADGFFVIKESSKPDRLVPSLPVENSHIVTDKSNMSTKIKGLFAAGDITGKPYQVMKACGEGQVAALSAVKYLDDLKKNG